jgi:hypothetical protein
VHFVRNAVVQRRSGGNGGTQDDHLPFLTMAKAWYGIPSRPAGPGLIPYRPAVRDDGWVSSGELMNEAVAELYACDLEAFTERRGILAARARAAGESAVAKEIAGLRKPTRSAWILNQLVRTDPGVPSRLTALGDELRAAEAALDGARIRELSQARRQLVDALTRQALNAPGLPPASAALQEEVTATFRAALADPHVAEQLAAGTLLRPVQRAGFSSQGRAVLALVPPPEEGRPSRAAAGAGSRTAPRPATRPAAEEAAARAERERSRAIADAERALADASLAADAARAAEQEQLGAARRIEEQLAEARERLADARSRVRRATTAQRMAQHALDRLRR